MSDINAVSVRVERTNDVNVTVEAGVTLGAVLLGGVQLIKEVVKAVSVCHIREG